MRWLLQVAAFAWLNLLVAGAGASSLPDLRIQPLGDSITKGALSSHGNGYRGYLRDMLSEESDKQIDMIGSLRFGNMDDNDHEGHSGHFLREISEYYKRSIRARPNVVLIHAGINNMDKEIDLDESPELMGKLIDGVHKDAPDAAILVMPLLWCNDSRLRNNSDNFNRILDDMIEERADDDVHIVKVPINNSLSDLSDYKHPNDQGYEKMAKAWFAAIKDVNELGWLEDPVEVEARELPGMGLGTKHDEKDEDDNNSDDEDDHKSGDEDDDDHDSDDDDDSAASKPFGAIVSGGLLRCIMLATCLVWSSI